jgi:hypothetical protein
MDDNKSRPLKIEESIQLGIPIAMARTAICPPWKCLGGLRNLGDFGRIYLLPTAIVFDAHGAVSAKMQGGSGVRDGLESAVKNVLRAAELSPALAR